ncbi:MAG: methylmalonyl-CoA mutase family protein, partial [Thermodesulfobacteriota bacterium]
MAKDDSARKEDKGLFDEFTAPTYDEWYKEAVASLKGESFEKKVITKTYEDIDVKPLYLRQDIENLAAAYSLPGFSPYLRSDEAAGYLERPWRIAQAVAEPAPQRFSQVAAKEVARGQDALLLSLCPAARRCEDPAGADLADFDRGLAAFTAADFAAALSGLDMADLPLFLSCGATALPALALVAANVDPKSLAGAVTADPLAELAREGSLPLPLAAAYNSMAQCTQWAIGNAPGLRTIEVSAAPYHDAGASAVQELAYALATGTLYLSAMAERGISVDNAAPRFVFNFSVGRNMFMEIAKLRAARALWAQAVAAMGGNAEAQKMYLCARTSFWTKTAYDPYVNLLRNTIEAFSAVMGGARAITVTPFDAVVRHPDEFSRRVSRNLQLLLREEARFTRPVDPLGGSYALESLTDSVSRRAWAAFQEIQKQGGMETALLTGAPQKACAATAAKKAAAVAKRKDVFVGVNMYPNAQEPSLADAAPDLAAIKKAAVSGVKKAAFTKELADIGSQPVSTAIAAAKAGASLAQILGAMQKPGSPVGVEKLSIRRGAEAFENLRKKAAAHSGTAL